jgi:NAD(P)-dependent dehydrogenase (short-subunit alcohol dehydrogenase family)
MTKIVLDNGDIAIATLRKPSALDDLKAKYPPSKLHILKLDVTNKDDIAAAFKYAEEKLGRIDIVFNNAGCTVVGEIEGTPHDVAKKMFDVNFWGAMNVSKEAVRFFREVNKPQGGRLWTVSSTAGIFPFAAMGYYSASKHGTVVGIVCEGHSVTGLISISSRRCHRDPCHRTRPKVEHQGRYNCIPSETV